MLKQLQNYIDQNSLFDKEETQLLGLSGGVDSMVLLHALNKLGYKIVLAHCNFQLRNKESEEDQKILEEYCKQNSFRLFTKRFNTSEYAKKQKISIQMAARELRFNWFQELCLEHKFQRILIAHNANDQAETFFINILRGSGIKGLKGMLPLNGNIARPLLSISRAEIIEYQLLNSIPFREDSSNVSDKYLRNNLRHNVLPLLENVDAEFVRKINSAMNRLQLSNRFIENELLKYREIKDLGSNQQELKIGTWIHTENGLFILFELLSEFDFNFAQIREVYSALLDKKRNKLFYSSEYEICTDVGALLILKKNSDASDKHSVELTPDVTKIYHPIHLDIENIENPGDNYYLHKETKIAYLDKNKLSFPLSIRKWQRGDSFVPLGMKRYKKISDFMIDNKFSYFQKQQAWVLCNSDNEIIWFIGYRISEKFKVGEETKEILKIIYNDNN